MKRQNIKKITKRLAQIGVVSALSLGVTLANADMHGAGEQAAMTNHSPGFSNAGEITRVSTLIDRRVTDRQDNALGKVVDIAINNKTGVLGYLVVESNRGSLFNRPTERYIAVPLDSIDFATDGTDALIIHTSERQFSSVEAFSGDDWPLVTTLTATSLAGAGPMAPVTVQEIAAEPIAVDETIEEQTNADSSLVTSVDGDALADTDIEWSEDAEAEAEALGSADVLVPEVESDSIVVTETGVIAESDMAAEPDSIVVAETGVVAESDMAAEPDSIVVAETGVIAESDMATEPDVVTNDPEPSVVLAEPNSDAAVFNVLDSDDDGYLSSDELDTDVAEMQAADEDADGKLNQAEFAAFELMHKSSVVEPEDNEPMNEATPEVLPEVE